MSRDRLWSRLFSYGQFYDILHSDLLILTFPGVNRHSEKKCLILVSFGIQSKMSARILHIAYDAGLLETRSLMLKSRGYQVTSALGNKQAMALASGELDRFDLAVIGFSSTHAARTEVLAWMKSKSARLPVVVLQYHEFEKFPQADCVTMAEDPCVWLDAVEKYAHSH